MKGQFWKPWHSQQSSWPGLPWNHLKGIKEQVSLWRPHSNSYIPFHGSLLWLREASSASLIRSSGHMAWVSWLQGLLRHTGTFWTSGAAGANQMLDAWRATIWVTWPFSFTHADIRAGDSASQIRHGPSDQNWMIWKDVALQHSGLTDFGLVVFGDGELSC